MLNAVSNVSVAGNGRIASQRNACQWCYLALHVGACWSSELFRLTGRPVPVAPALGEASVFGPIASHRMRSAIDRVFACDDGL